MLPHKTCCIEILIKYTHRKDIAYLSLEENVKERFVIVRLIFFTVSQLTLLSMK